MVPILTVITGHLAGTVFRFNPAEEKTQTLGRDREADLVLADPTLSSFHAEFSWKKIGDRFQMQVNDLESTNGTYHDGKKIDTVVLRDGERIQLGDVVLRFQRIEDAELEERQRLLAKASLAERDALTGLANRRYLDESLPRMLEGIDASSTPLCLVVFDLDHFKSVNDTFGHLAGDEVIKLAASVIQGKIRNTDVAIRYGGEEFVVLLPGSRLDEGALVAERIRYAVARTETAQIAEGIVMTVSGGVAQRLPGEQPAATIARADAALYRAKRTGRNRVERAPEEPLSQDPR